MVDDDRHGNHPQARDCCNRYFSHYQIQSHPAIYLLEWLHPWINHGSSCFEHGGEISIATSKEKEESMKVNVTRFKLGFY